MMCVPVCKKAANQAISYELERTTKVQIRLTPLDAGFDSSKVVTDHIPVIEKTGKFSDEGVFSERIFGRMPSSGREYACDCGAVEGRFYERTICKECGTPVTCRDTVFSKRGWVDLGRHKILSPLFYMYFSRVVGPTQLNRILHQHRVLSVDGIAQQQSEGGPFDGMGIMAFVERWQEVLDHFEAKKKNDLKVAEFARVIRENPELVTTSKIPVFSHILRPALMVDKQMVFDEVNNIYNLLIANADIIRNYTPEEATEANVNSVLWRVQERANELFNHVLHVLSGKGGYLRGSMLGVRINFSARCVITPLPPGHEPDEIIVPYLTFLELYRFQLTNLLARMNGVTIAKANDIWHESQTRFDRSTYAAMRELIKRASPDGRGLPALINRNPTISFGSILQARIVGVKKDPKDYTMSVHNCVLKLMGGDFDGDVIAVIPLLDRDLASALSVYDPRRMTVSRDGQRINRSMTLEKDNVLGLSVLTENRIG